jgi:hypothetical protein
VVYSGTNTLTFTNAVLWNANVSAVDLGADNLTVEGAIYFTEALTNIAVTRTNLGLGATWLTNVNVTNFRTAIGLGAANNVTFDSVSASEFSTDNGVNGESLSGFGIVFVGNSAAATRTNLGFPLQALTNTSNVTMMRALAGSTNTNEPFSGSFQWTDPDDSLTYTATVSNGIILRVEEY